MSADLDDARATVEIDTTLYPIDAVYGAAYVLIDRCYVLLDRAGAADGEAGRVRVTLTPKRPGEHATAALREAVGELANELLSCAYRLRIHAENRALLEAVTMRAMAGAMGPPSLDDLEGFDFSGDAFEDPLGIALSWEEKYGKKTPPEAGEGPPAASREGEPEPGAST